MTIFPSKGNPEAPQRPGQDRWPVYGQIATAVAAVAALIKALITK